MDLAMSALPSEADIWAGLQDVCFVPRTDIDVIILRSAHASKTKRVPVYERRSFVGIAARAAS